jgi:putative Ca2+/H+ antiporter (TMEM165/GDT1 family)
LSAATVLTVFAVIAVAELPDKTMIATLVMGSRGDPLFVWIGSAAAFCGHVALAVLAGQLLVRLPHTALQIVIASVFALGAGYLLFVPERVETARGEREARRGRLNPRWAIALSAFGVIALGEFGDLTQLLTINFVARTHSPWSVALGAAAALLTVSAIGAFSGRALLRLLPTSLIRRGGGVVLAGFAIATAVSLATG